MTALVVAVSVAPRARRVTHSGPELHVGNERPMMIQKAGFFRNLGFGAIGKATTRDGAVDRGCEQERTAS